MEKALIKKTVYMMILLLCLLLWFQASCEAEVYHFREGNLRCSDCHTVHYSQGGEAPYNDALEGPYRLLLKRDMINNDLCLNVLCHGNQAAGYPANEGLLEAGISHRWPEGIIGYEYAGYFECNNGSTRKAGLNYRSRWPGAEVYRNLNYSPHGNDENMPLKDNVTDGKGLCLNCHDPHGGTNPFDMLKKPYLNIGGAEEPEGAAPSNYQLCFDCHSTSNPEGMEEKNKHIAGYYSISGDPTSGHQIGGSTGAVSLPLPDHVASGDKLPCYNCHNPHGSQGHDGHPNAHLLSDQREGWNGLTDTLNDPNQCRRFCFGCHVPSDKYPADWGSPTVEGIEMAAITSRTVHESTSRQSCHNCHGRDYSSSSSYNVHHPCSGSCDSCHAKGTNNSHQTHAMAGGRGVNLICDDCHGSGADEGAHSGHGNALVNFTDGNSLTTTTVCNNCHSPGGAFNGIIAAETPTGPSVGAK